ncbi:unnamed protein product, partial [Rotaria sordida]
MVGGFERTYEYNSILSSQAKIMLEQRWNTQGKDLVPNDTQAPYFKMIQLPDLREYKQTDTEAIRLLTDLIIYHNLISMI